MDGGSGIMQHFISLTILWQAPELLVHQEEPEEDNNPPMMRTTETDIYALGMVRIYVFIGFHH